MNTSTTEALAFHYECEDLRSEKIYAHLSLMPTYVTSPFSLLEVVDNVNITVKPLHKWQTEAHTTLVGILYLVYLVYPPEQS